jgi:hypothetical protein
MNFTGKKNKIMSILTKIKMEYLIRLKGIV